MMLKFLWWVLFAVCILLAANGLKLMIEDHVSPLSAALLSAGFVGNYVLGAIAVGTRKPPSE